MNIIVFDTETLGMKSQDLLNVGYRILDINLITAEIKVLRERDMIDYNLFNAVSKLYTFKGCLENDKEWILSSNFLNRVKFDKYNSAITNKTIERHSIKKIYEIIAQDIKRYKVILGYAYNCFFDIDKFEKTALKHNIVNPLKDLPIMDIWAYAVNHICRTDDYIQWARANSVFTQSEQYISTSVESVTKYLLKDLTFVEEHTALSDTKWETAILLHCLKQGCDITKAERKGANIPSGKTFNKTILLPSGERLNVEYTKSIKREIDEYYYEKN